MKNRAVQYGVIGLSASLVITVGILAFEVAREFMQADVLDAELTVQDVAVPESYDSRMEKGNQLFEAGYFELAANEYSIAVSIESSAEPAYTKLGKTYLKLGNYTDALSSLKRAYELSPSDSSRVNYAIALLRNRKYEEAKSLLSSGNMDHQGTVFYFGILQAYLGNYDDAKAQMEKALTLSGSVPTAYLQNFENVFLNYDSVQGGQSSYLKATLTKAFIDSEEYPLAEDTAMQVLSEQSDYRDVWILLGYSQLQTKKYAEAEDAFKQAESLDAVKPETHYFLGVAHYEQKEYSEAVDAFELALLYNFQPESEAYLKIADCQTQLGNYEDAVAAYEYLIKIDHTDLELFEKALDLTLNQLGDLDRALTLAQESTSYFPSEAESYTLLAEVYLKRGEVESADSSIDTAFDIDPNSAEAHYLAAQVRLAQNNIEGAKWELKKTYELSTPGDTLSVEAAQQYNNLILSKNEPS